MLKYLVTVVNWSLIKLGSFGIKLHLQREKGGINMSEDGSMPGLYLIAAESQGASQAQ